MVSLENLFLFNLVHSETQRHSFRLTRRKGVLCENHRTFV